MIDKIVCNALYSEKSFSKHIAFEEYQETICSKCSDDLGILDSLRWCG